MQKPTGIEHIEFKKKSNYYTSLQNIYCTYMNQQITYITRRPHNANKQTYTHKTSKKTVPQQQRKEKPVKIIMDFFL